jgi:CheY-like chemotaxis protein
MGARILVIDDSITIRRVVTGILTKNGYEPIGAADGFQALSVLKDREQPTVELVLLDFVMPKMTGYEFCRRIRADASLRHLPVVLMSAKAEKIRGQFVEQTGAIDAISKPFDARALLVVIEGALARLRSGKPQREAPSAMPSSPPPSLPPSAPYSTPHGARGLSGLAVDVGHVAPVGLNGAAALGVGGEGPDAASAAGASAPADAPDQAGGLAEGEAPHGGPAGEVGGRGAAPPPREVTEFAAALAEILMPALDTHAGGLRFPGGALAQAATAAIERGVAARLLPHLERLAHGPGRKQVLRGQAEAVPLGEILQVLQMQQQTGELVVGRGAIEVTLHFRKGLVDLAGSRGASEEFRLGRYFVEEGLIDREMLESVAIESGRAGQLLGDALVAKGAVTPDQLQEALGRQASELIYEVLRWERASFAFFRLDAEAAPRGAEAQLGLPVASLVMEGFRRVDEWRLIEEMIDFENVLHIDQAALDRMGLERLGRREKMVLEAIDGERTVRDVVVQSNVTSFEACKILYQLLQSRILRRRTAQ